MVPARSAFVDDLLACVRAAVCLRVCASVRVCVVVCVCVRVAVPLLCVSASVRLFLCVSVCLCVCWSVCLVSVCLWFLGAAFSLIAARFIQHWSQSGVLSSMICLPA